VKTSSYDSAGFTLVEVLMAMLVLMVGLLGLLQSVNVAYEHNSRNRLREEAVLVGEEQMSKFRLREFDNITATRSVSTVTRVVTGATKNFSVTRQCQLTGSDSKRLKVAVGWSFKRVSSAHVIYSMRSR